MHFLDDLVFISRIKLTVGLHDCDRYFSAHEFIITTQQFPFNEKFYLNKECIEDSFWQKTEKRIE